MIKACKKCRREGEKLLIKGERCLSPKCAMVKRAYAPGQHGQSFFGKLSEYGKQLREKQRARRIYGIGESQFRKYADEAERMQGNTADNLMKLLETRLDNLVYRLGLGLSRSHARQEVSHGMFAVNGQKVTIPSFQIKVGDVIGLARKGKTAEARGDLPGWISFDKKTLQAKISHFPSRDEIDAPINETLIIEFYSR